MSFFEKLIGLANPRYKQYKVSYRLTARINTPAITYDYHMNKKNVFMTTV